MVGHEIECVMSWKHSFPERSTRSGRGKITERRQEIHVSVLKLCDLDMCEGICRCVCSLRSYESVP